MGLVSDGGRFRQLVIGSQSLVDGLAGEPSYLFLEVLLMLVMLIRFGLKQLIADKYRRNYQHQNHTILPIHNQYHQCLCSYRSYPPIIMIERPPHSKNRRITEIQAIKFIMGQKCCAEMGPAEYNNIRTTQIRRKSTKKPSQQKYSEPSLLAAVSAVERRLGEVRYNGNYERGTLGKLQALDNEGTFYRGEYREERPHGLGKMFFPDGSIFTGYFYDGIPHGEGRMITNQGIYYEGQVFEGQADGQGRLCNDLKGYNYEGKWKKDAPEGFGKQAWTGTSEYEGDFLNGAKSGTGFYRKFGEFQYRGGFMNNKFQGVGRIVYTNGQIYEGEWQNGEYNGIGKYIWADRSEYLGGFLKGKKHGEGTYKLSDGRSFEGAWVEGKRHGMGKLTKGTDFIEGRWVDDKFVSDK